MLLDKGIIDVHAHILPGVDDGCRYIGETIELLKLAYEQGVSGVIATPHYVRGHNRADADRLREKMQLLREKAAEALPEMKLYQGQEILYYGKTGFRRNINSGRDKICSG